MKKHYIFYLLIASLLAGCNNNATSESNSVNTSGSGNEITNTDSSEQTPQLNTYATVNSENDVVYVYGVIGETFNVDTIRFNNTTKEVSFRFDAIGLSYNEATKSLSLNEVGLYDVGAFVGTEKVGHVKVLVNDSEATRYNYPETLNLNNYRQHSGTKNGKIEVDGQTIKLTAVGPESSDWHRITYPLDPYLNTNYTIECDVKLNSTDSSRWFGLVFRSDEKTGLPYYQFDFRLNTAASNAVELTQINSSGAYSYLHQGKWGVKNPGTLTKDDVVHMKLTLDDYNAYCLLSTGEYSSEFEVKLPNTLGGEFGFQTSNTVATIENIQISYNKDVKVRSFADVTQSYVNIKDNTSIDALKAQLILAGQSYGEHSVIHEDAQQIYAVAKSSSVVELYDRNNNLMDVSLNDMIKSSKGKYILHLQIEDLNTANNVLAVFKSHGLVDATIWSTNGEILDLCHQTTPELRLGYIPTNLTSFESWDEVGSICREAGKHYANLILVDGTLLNKENVHKVTGLGYTVVGNAKSSDSYSVLDCAMDGCSLILADVNLSTLEQANKLYDKSLFYSIGSTKSLFAAPYITGHRGSGNTSKTSSSTDPTNTLYPENTVAAFKRALDNGADAVEIDIHLTKDNQLAVIHNASTGEYANKDLKVSTSTMAQLKELDLYVAGTGKTEHKIPTMNEVLEALNDPKYANTSMVVEIKDNLPETGFAAIDLVKQYGWYNRITFITFSASTAAKVKAYDPGFSVSYLGDAVRQTNEAYWSVTNQYYPLGVSLASQYSTLSKESIQESNARGQVNWLWTLGYTTNAKTLELIEYGNKAFTTNYVGDFTNNNYKIEVENISLAKNETKKLDASAVSYVDAKTSISDFEIIVLSNNATASGTNLTRTGDGDIYIIIKHKTEWTLYSSSKNYYIYSEVIKI